jgi:hypothetical protein
MSNQEFVHVATFSLLRDDQEFIILSNGPRSEDNRDNFLLVRPDGTIFQGGGLPVLKRLHDALRDSLVEQASAVFEDEEDEEPNYLGPESPALGSTLISSLSYDRTDHSLGICFRTAGGHVYIYDNVPEYVYRDLLYAKSPGRYFNQHIKGQYPLRNGLDEPTPQAIDYGIYAQ